MFARQALDRLNHLLSPQPCLFISTSALGRTGIQWLYSLWALVSVVVRGAGNQPQALQNLCRPATFLASFNDGRAAELYRISKY